MSKKVNSISLLVFMFSLSLSGYSSQTHMQKSKPKKFLENIKANYNDLESVQIAMNYQLYKGYQTKELVQEYNSQFYRIGNSSYRKIGNIELISNADFTLNVDHENKTVLVSKPSIFSAFDTDIESTLKLCSDIRLTEEDGLSVVSLIIRTKTDLPFSMLQLKVDKNFWIKEISIYYSRKIDFSNNYFDKDLATPKLVISYDVTKKKWKDKDDLLLTERYINIENDKLTASDWLSTYQVYDLRNSK